MSNLLLPDAGLGFVEEGEVLMPLQVNQALWRAQQMLIEMTNVLDVKRRNRIRQEDLVQVLNDRVAQQGEQLQQYKAAMRSQMAAQVSEMLQDQYMQNQGNNSAASRSRQPEAELPPSRSSPYMAGALHQPQANVSLPRISATKLDLPKPFGNKKEQDVSDWISQMTLFFSASEIEEAAWGLRAAMNLESKVLTWYRSLGVDPRQFSWADLSQGLLQNFCSPDYKVRARDSLDSCKQTGSASGYVAAYRRELVQCTNVGADQALHRFIRGLKYDCRAYVRLQGPQNLAAAYMMADRYESSQEDPDRLVGQSSKYKQPAANHKQYDGQPGKSDGRPVSKGFLRAEGKQLEKINGKQKKKFSGNCYVCGKAGHRAQDCFKKASAVNMKGKANVAQGVPKQENE